MQLQRRLPPDAGLVGQQETQRLGHGYSGGAISAIAGDEPAGPLHDQVQMPQIFKAQVFAPARFDDLAGGTHADAGHAQQRFVIGPVELNREPVQVVQRPGAFGDPARDRDPAGRDPAARIPENGRTAAASRPDINGAPAAAAAAGSGPAAGYPG